VAREVLAESGFDPNAVLLAAEAPDERLAAALAVRPEVKIVDFTGSTAFGDWLEEHARQARVYTEKAGVNMVLIESTGDYAGMLANLAFSLVLYSGQMCTTPQDLLVPAAGIGTNQGHKEVAEIAADLGAAIDTLLGPDAQAVELLGAIVNDDVLSRLDAAAARAAGAGRVAVPSRAVGHPAFPAARVRTPLVVSASAPAASAGADVDEIASECFGPVSYLVSTPDAAAAVELFRTAPTRPTWRRCATRRLRRAWRCRRTSPAACTSTSRPRSPTSTRPGGIPRRTPVTPTAISWLAGSASSSPAATSPPSAVALLAAGGDHASGPGSANAGRGPGPARRLESHDQRPPPRKSQQQTGAGPGPR
jgi:acyl-CoA reductase-like NAD-dependent aldehyde dehydrogenase